MKVGARVEQERKAQKLSQQALADKVTRLGGDITQGGIDKLEKRDSARPRYLRELAIALNVTDDWLLTGRGPKARDSESSTSVSSNIPTKSEATIEQRPGAVKEIPEIDVRAGAGGGGVMLEVFTHDGSGNSVATDDVRAVWGIPSRFLREELRAAPLNVRIVEVMGDSMLPTLKPGDRVFVDTNHRVPSPPDGYIGG